MPRLVYVSPNMVRQLNVGTGTWSLSPPQYIATSTSDPNIPAGFVLTGGSDGAEDSALQVFQTGYHSGGFPVIAIPDPNDTQAAAYGGKAPNGILGGPIGSIG